MSIIAVSNRTLECESNPCLIYNGGCEDICDLDESNQIKCSCHPGRFLIQSDQKRCAWTRQKCEENHEFQCSQALNNDPICIPYSLTCDGISHCPDDSDEDIRYCSIRKCKTGYFQCANNRCINTTLTCNQIDDCGDFSDEYESCTCPEKHQFKCSNGPCIDDNLKCNFVPDCPDASDEMDCSPVRNCSMAKMLNCNSTTACIKKEWICDGHDDCWDNSDEEHCHDMNEINDDNVKNCPKETTFQCDDGKFQ